MKLKLAYAVIMLMFSAQFCHAQKKCGAVIPWTTYEAEHMKTDGKVMGAKYDPYLVEY